MGVNVEMGSYFAVFFSALLLAVGVALVWDRAVGRWEVPLSAVLVGFLIFGVGAFSPMYYEFPKNNGVIATYEDAQLVLHPRGTFCWDDCFVVPTLPTRVSAGVMMLTANPKVQEFGYELAVEIVDPARFYRVPGRRTLRLGYSFAVNISSVTGKGGRYSDEPTLDELVAKLVAPHLYWFRNEHSSELARFSDPFSGTQRRELEALICESLNPQIELDGLRATLERFWVE